MTTNADAFQAGIDAVTGTLTKGEFADAIRTVVDSGYSDAEAKDWIDAIAVEYNRIGVINNSTYASLRSKINDDKAVATELFAALAASIALLPETDEVDRSLQLSDLRAERDEIDGNIDILVALKPGQPRQVKDAIQLGVEQLRGYKQAVRDQIQSLTGNPDS